MMNNYELQKYQGMSSRYECPACHQRGTFARYIDTSTGRHLSAEVGRCNREDKCGYHYTPRQYFADHSEAGMLHDTTPIRCATPRRSPIRREQEPPKEIDRIPKQWLVDSLGYNSNFVRFLCTLFDVYDISSPTLRRLMKEYYLGCTKDEAVIYWQIDGQKRIRAGKIMQYNPMTGKRIKNSTGAIDWVHSALKRRGDLPDEWELSQCLFGEHLLRRRPGDTVCLVESEKSAIIGAGMMPEYVWLATGGKQNFKSETCRCLRGRHVILFPDLGAYDLWQQKAKQIAIDAGCTIQVSALLEQTATDAERADGLDIADYLIRQIKAAMPIVEVARPFTQEEHILRDMVAKNPLVAMLIESLDLVSTATGTTLQIN